MYKVYLIINIMGTVEYVGTSKDPKRRYREHRTKQYQRGKVSRGLFKGRQDIFMVIEEETFETSKEAELRERDLKMEYGLINDNLTDSQRNTSAAGKSKPSEEWKKSVGKLMSKVKREKGRKRWFDLKSGEELFLSNVEVSERYNIFQATVTNIKKGRTDGSKYGVSFLGE